MHWRPPLQTNYGKLVPPSPTNPVIYVYYCKQPVCLSARIPQKPQSKLHEIHVNCSHGSTLSDLVLPVLWTTSCFHILEPMGQNQRQRYVSSTSPGGSTGTTLLSTAVGLAKVIFLRFNAFILPFFS